MLTLELRVTDATAVTRKGKWLRRNTKLLSSETTHGACDKAAAESTLLSRKVPWHIELVTTMFGFGFVHWFGDFKWFGEVSRT